MISFVSSRPFSQSSLAFPPSSSSSSRGVGRSRCRSRIDIVFLITFFSPPEGEELATPVLDVDVELNMTRVVLQYRLSLSLSFDVTLSQTQNRRQVVKICEGVQ